VKRALVTGAGSEACTARLRADGFVVVEAPEGGIDVLVACAGERFEGSIEETPDDVFRGLLAANLTAPFRVARACFGRMREQGGGSMIFVASDAGIRARHELAAFSVSMAGLVAVAELFAAEGAEHGIRSNAVCPGEGVDVTPAVAWLASDASAHVNGATLRIDGGAGAAMRVVTRTP
jgi:NAD(P)-dependent dehydrogenase (short-subunit alcohol dehydrogenase family)